MSIHVFDRLESSVRGYIRSFPAVFASANGSWIMDEDGKEYLDFFSGAGTLNYGHNPEPLKGALISYLQHNGIIHGLDMGTQAKRRFIETFEALILLPRSMQYKLQFTGPTGTNAVEAAIKLARQYTGRTNVVCFTNAFHGVSLGSLASTGNEKFRRAAGVPLGNTTFLPYDGYVSGLDSIAYFRQLLEDPSSGLDLPAAVIVETVQGEGGVNVASDDWLRDLQALCRTHGILLIVDDIQVGCGRTGSFFSFEGAGISPDIITLSKSLSGFGLPMSLVLIKPEIDIWKPSAHNGTFRGHNAAFVTATEALTHFWSDGKFVDDVSKKAKMMSARLQEIQSRSRLLTAMRSKGMIAGLAFENAGLAEKVSRQCFESGLIIETCGPRGEVLKLLPPLTIGVQDLEAGLDIVDHVVTGVVLSELG